MGKMEYSTVATGDDDVLQCSVPVASPVVELSSHKRHFSDEDEAGDQLSWTDDYFTGAANIVAVFDHDPTALYEHYISGKHEAVCNFWTFFWFLLLCVPVSVVCLSLLPGAVAGFLGTLLAMLAVGGIAFARSLLKAKYPSFSGESHTAVKQTGIRHVLADPKAQYEVHIPFDEIVSIHASCENAVAKIEIEMASNDGSEYVIHGIPVFEKTYSGGSWLSKLVLIGLKEPFRFKKLVMQMKKNLSEVSIVSNTILERVEAALESENTDDWKNALCAARDGLRKQNLCPATGLTSNIV